MNFSLELSAVIQCIRWQSTEKNCSISGLESLKTRVGKTGIDGQREGIQKGKVLISFADISA